MLAINAEDLERHQQMRKEIELHYQHRVRQLRLSYLSFLQLSTLDLAWYRQLMTPVLARPFKVDQMMIRWTMMSQFGIEKVVI